MYIHAYINIILPIYPLIFQTNIEPPYDVPPPNNPKKI